VHLFLRRGKFKPCLGQNFRDLWSLKFRPALELIKAEIHS
jgi:hypothetical protein